MGYREDMRRCREYIDANMAQEIRAQELAEQFGYSFYHFCHVFQSVCGMSVGRYLRERRLCRAASELLEGRRVTDVAADCGFDTPAGFTKAFTRYYGISPSKYKKRKGGMIRMTPEFRKMDGFSAIGYVIKPDGEVDHRENGAFWLGKDFSSVSQEDYARLTFPGYGEIGAWMHPDEGGELYYFFGPQVKSKDFIPAGMMAIDVPAAEYAVFTVPAGKDVKELHAHINQTWKFIFNDWFDGSDYAFDHSKMDFEFYCGEDTFIYVPVVKKSC